MTTSTKAVFEGNYLVWGEESIAVYSCDGAKYPVTDCCKATAKGTEWGICCRSCYEEVDSLYGMYWDEEMWADDLASGRIVKADTQ